MKDLGMVALIHDVSMIVYEQKLNKLTGMGGQMLEPAAIKKIFDQHPYMAVVEEFVENFHEMEFSESVLYAGDNKR